MFFEICDQHNSRISARIYFFHTGTDIRNGKITDENGCQLDVQDTEGLHIMEA